MALANPLSMSPGYRRGPVLDWRMPFVRLFFIFLIGFPVAIWFGGDRPDVFEPFMQPWPATWAQWVAAGCMAVLMVVPLVWVLASRVLDLMALNMGLNALLVSGYFFLGLTAWNLPDAARGILEAGSLVVLVNAIGFGCFFSTLAVSYSEPLLRAARLPPLLAPPEELDRRLAWFLRFGAAGTAVMIALPMAVSGTIPLLAADPVEARLAMVQSDAARALYHVGSAMLPFITGGLIMLILRKPVRAFGMDGGIVAGIVLVQILTSNRLPLAITLFVTVTLVTIERKFSRWVLAALFAGLLFLYAGLSGLTSTFRQEKELLGQGNILVTSIQQAFLGDNLIDLRDAAWVFSEWDFQPLEGKTYLGGLASLVPSGLFPQKKEWHLGLTGLRIVGWDTEEHFGLRITFFGEAFLNFGPAGVVLLGVLMGGIYGSLLRRLHMVARKRPPCLHGNLRVAVLMQMFLPLSNSSDGYMFWAMAAFQVMCWLAVDFPLHMQRLAQSSGVYAPSRA